MRPTYKLNYKVIKYLLIINLLFIGIFYFKTVNTDSYAEMIEDDTITLKIVPTEVISADFEGIEAQINSKHYSTEYITQAKLYQSQEIAKHYSQEYIDKQLEQEKLEQEKIEKEKQAKKVAETKKQNAKKVSTTKVEQKKETTIKETTKTETVNDLSASQSVDEKDLTAETTVEEVTTEEVTTETKHEEATEKVTEEIVDEKPKSNNIYGFSQDEVNMLYSLVYLEAGSTSQKCQMAVTSVVLNLMRQEGKSLYNTIYTKGRFSVASRIKSTRASDSTKKAVDYVLQNGITIPKYVNCFRNNHYFSWATPYTCIDNVYFSSY